MKEALKSYSIGICVMYFVAVFIFAIYFSWLYAKEHGFIAWIFFGEIVPFFKAIVWPYFIFF